MNCKSATMRFFYFSSLFATLFSCSVSNLFSQNQWAMHGGGPGNEQAHQATATLDGGFILVGQTDSYGAGGTDVYIVKLNPAGQLQWTKTVGGSGNDVGRGVVQTADGGYVVAGWTNSFGNGGDDFYLIRLDGNGQLLWTKAYGGTGNDRAWALIQDQNGGFALCGQTSSFGASPNQFYLVKTDAQGSLLWDRRSGVSGVANIGYSLVQSPDSGYVMAGSTYNWTGSGSTSSTDVYAVKLDKLGNQVWATRVQNSRDDDARSIIQTQDGGYALLGKKYMVAESTWDIYMVKLSASGQLLWDVSYGMTNSEEGYSVMELEDGSLMATGVILPAAPIANTWYDLYVVKFSSAGLPLWDRMFNSTLYGSGGNSSNLADYNVGRSIFRTSDGGYGVAGYLGAGNSGAGTEEIFFLKFTDQDASCWPWQSGGVVGPGTATFMAIGSSTACNGIESTGGTESSGGSISFLCSVIPLSVQSSFTASCASLCTGTAVASVFGGTAPFSYTWSPAGGNSDTASGLCPGPYTVTVVDSNGDSSIASVLIGAVSVDASVSASPDSLTFSANNQNPNANFLWVRCPDFSGNLGTQSSYSPVSQGSFALIVTENGCSDTSDCIVFTPTSGFDAFAGGLSVHMYPNPATSKVHFWREDVNVETRILVFDVMGKQLLERYFNDSDANLTLDFHYPSGLYFVEFISSNGKSTQRLIVQD
jgi:hypothetical protein